MFANYHLYSQANIVKLEEQTIFQMLRAHHFSKELARALLKVLTYSLK